jgi:hypothetical protein
VNNEQIGVEDGTIEGGLFALLRVQNATSELWADEAGRGLVILLSHTCDFSEKFRLDARRQQPLLVAPVVPLSFLGDWNAELSWDYGWEGAMKHVLPLPPAPPHFGDRAAVLLRFTTAIQPDVLDTPLIGLSLRERQRLRQQLARFFSRAEVDVAEFARQEAEAYGTPENQP